MLSFEHTYESSGNGIKQYQRTNKQNGIREKAKQGKLITTHAPFGYRYRKGCFVVQEEEAYTVKSVYRWYLQGLGYKKISQHLDSNPNLIPRKPYQVRNILLNPNYCGRVINNMARLMISFHLLLILIHLKKHKSVVFINNSIDPILEIS